MGGPGSQRRGASGLPSLCSRQPHRALLPADGKKAGAKYWSWEEGSRDAKSRSSKEYQAPDAGVKHALLDTVGMLVLIAVIRTKEWLGKKPSKQVK